LLNKLQRRKKLPIKPLPIKPLPIKLLKTPRLLKKVNEHHFDRLLSWSKNFI
jgi:hypothetical protein